jgi:hypothetical protein
MWFLTMFDSLSYYIALPFRPVNTKGRVRISDVLAQFAPALVFVGSFIVYILTAAPTVFGFDSAEYAAAAYNLGVPHPTGYPLYLLLGKLFTYLPFGDVAYRLNLMSGFFSSATVTVAYLLAFLVSRRVVLSIAIAGFLAFSYYFWSASVIAEVYSLHGFLNAITIYLLLLWNRSGNSKLLYGAGFIWGLSFGNHMTTALLGPAVAFLVGLGLWEKRIKWPQLFPLAVCTVLPLSIYLYLPLRYLAGAVPYALGYYDIQGNFVRTDTTTIEGVWSALTASQFGVFFLAHQGVEYVNQLGQAMFWVYGNFLGAGLILGLLGIIRNFMVDKRRLIFLSLIFIANMLFFASYGAPDRSFMFLVGYIVWSVWMADGMYLALTTIESTFPKDWQGKLVSALGPRARLVCWETLSLLVVIVALWANFSYVDLSSFTIIRDRYPQMMNSLEPNALVLAWWPDSAPMYYFQQVENIRQDVQIVDRFLISAEAEQRLIERALPDRAVYVFGQRVRPIPLKYKTIPVISDGFETGYMIVSPRRQNQSEREVDKEVKQEAQ